MRAASVHGFKLLCILPFDIQSHCHSHTRTHFLRYMTYGWLTDKRGLFNAPPRIIGLESRFRNSKPNERVTSRWAAHGHLQTRENTRKERNAITTSKWESFKRARERKTLINIMISKWRRAPISMQGGTLLVEAWPPCHEACPPQVRAYMFRVSLLLHLMTNSCDLRTRKKLVMRAFQQDIHCCST